jgi:valacyclovir hydrolase
MPYLEVRGVRLYYEERGQGSPLLCLPGALGTGATDFAPQLEELSQHFRVIAPDPRGYGKSRPPERDFPLDFIQRDCEDMATLMAALGCQSFVVAGWSDGATASALMAVTYPERISKLIIWGGNAYLSSEDIEAYEKTRDISSWSSRMRERMESLYGDSLQDLWAGWCDGMKAIYQAGGEVCHKRLYLVRCPTLILHGEQDPLVPGFHPHVYHQGISNSRLHVFPEGRHNIHLFYAAEFNQLVREFLQEEGHGQG